MINGIIKGITEAIYNYFGEDYNIYIESIKQGLKEPCFFVKVSNPTNELFLFRRRKRTNTFIIQYFPQSDRPFYECSEVFEKLIEAIEYINADGDLLRGYNFQNTIVDDVMTVTVDYDFYTISIEDEDKMEELTTESEVKE